MKLRNQLLALACLFAFLAIGVLYFNRWVVQKPFGIILILGDTLTGQQLAAARLYSGGADEKLSLEEKLKHTAVVRASANDYAVPDSAAAATALATGRRTNNGVVARSPRDEPLESLLAKARAAGRSIGVVTNATLADPGMAPFIAQAADAKDADNLIAQLVDKTKPDVALGGGAHLFLPEGKNGKRKDGRDLLLELKERGDRIVRTEKELESAIPLGIGGFYGLFADAEMPYASESEALAQPTLSDLVRRAIQFLQFNTRGYVLIIDAGLITRAASVNEGEKVLSETIELDRAIRTAAAYAGDKTLIVATARTGIGGLALNGYPLRQDHGLALTGKNAFGNPSLTWASGPSTKENEPAAFQSEAAVPIATDVIAAATGPGSEAITGFLDQTDIHEFLRSKL